MFIKYVLLAIVFVLLVAILYDGFKEYRARRKEKKTLQSTQKAEKPPVDSSEPSAGKEE